jgi:cytochrome c peroxidase
MRRIYLSSVILTLAFADTVFAQRQHIPERDPAEPFIGGLIGEPPDASNWPHPAAPDGNPYPRRTASQAEIDQRDRVARLGKALFWDEQVSVDNTMACGTCHIPGAGGTDNRLGAVFARPGNRSDGNFGAFGVIRQNELGGTINYGSLLGSGPTPDRLVTPLAPPTMIGAYLFDRLFWDMRAGAEFRDESGQVFPGFDDWAALEALAVEPPISDIEMGHESLQWGNGFLQFKIGTSFPLALVVAGSIPPDVQAFLTTHGNPRYDSLFDAVFGSHPQFGGPLGVTRERFAMAIAHYQRELIPDRAPIDLGTMTAAQIAGFNFLRNQTSCFACHSASMLTSQLPTLGPNGRLVNPFDNVFSDGLPHTINLNTDPQRGLGGLQPPRKTASLRNIGLKKKFFSTGHGGAGSFFVSNFTELMQFYRSQFQFNTALGFNPTAQQLANVTAFLRDALTDPRVRDETFPFDRPKLRSETLTFGANVYGTGTAGPSTRVPKIIANMPPKIRPSNASQWFKVGVGGAAPSGDAALIISDTAATGPVQWVGPPLAVVPTDPTDADGFATVQLPFPLAPATLGLQMFVQWQIADSGSVALSNAAKFKIY